MEPKTPKQGAAPASKPKTAATSPGVPRATPPTSAAKSSANPAAAGGDLWKYIAGGVAVAAPAGYFLRKDGEKKQLQIKAFKDQVRKEPNKEKRDELSMQQAKLDKYAGPEFTGGTALMVMSVAFAIMIVLLGMGIRPRRAALILPLPLAFCALHAVYEAGILSMIVSALLAVGLIYFVTGDPDPRKKKEFDEFRHFPARREIDANASPYRQLSLRGQIEQSRLLKRVETLPPPFARMLPIVGEGRAFGFLQLKEDLAYVAFVEADDHNVSEYVSVLMLLDEQMPTFVVRPLPIVDGARVPNIGPRFAEDAAFTAQYLIELDPKANPHAVKSFLSPIVREELLSLPAVWLHVHGNVMALTLFGRYDAESVDHLVDMADVLFLDYGAEGGPSLLEPDGAEPLGPPKLSKKKKKKAPPAAAAALNS